MTYVLELSEQERQVLINLLDAAVKATGLSGAEAAVVLTKKISEKKEEQKE